MTSIIEKRLSLHRNVTNQQKENNSLRSQMSQLQALANIGTATCMIAHEINNLLTPLSTYAALALKNPEDKALTEKAFQKTVQNCERASRIMESMLAMADGQSQEKKDVKLITLVDEIFRGTNNRERLLGSESYIREITTGYGLGMVTTHDTKIRPTTRRSIASMPRASPTPSTAPTSVCVVEIGIPVPEAITMVVAAASSAAKPRLGVNSVMLVPTVAITLCP